ncbi:MAG TPA: Gfo/Idh/MocA family oxidoreductase, partial [Burkholderiales bacterium]
MAAFDHGALMLRTAFVGTGWWGGELAKAAASLPDVIEIAGFHSLDLDQCRRLREQHGGASFHSFEQVLSDKNVDAVVLATPHTLHVPQTAAAAAARKHVFVEKPLALDVDSARRAAAVCEKARVVLAVGHNRRFMPGARKIKELLEGGACGRVIHVEAHYSGDLMMRLPAGHWRLKRTEMPAAGMAPMGLHMADMLQWLLGPIARVCAVTKRQTQWTNGADLDDTCAALFELESGATGSLA